MAANPPVMTVLRSHPGVLYAVVAAAVAIALCALLALAWLLGWIPTAASREAAAPASATSDAEARAVGAVEALDPNETVVVSAESVKRAEPMMPTYSSPTPPPPAPLEADVVASPKLSPKVAIAPRAPAVAPAAVANAAPDSRPREPYVQNDAARPGPTRPSFTRGADARSAQASRSPPGQASCANCGVVSSITRYSGLWDVRVRLEEGGTQTFRYRTLPPYRIGDRVRVDGSHLTFD